MAKPDYFEWTNSKSSNKSFNVTAEEWNRLIDTVIAVHEYMGEYNESAYPMTKVEKGEPFYADYFNEVRFAIGSVYSTGLSDKSSGDPIKASDLNQLVTSINLAIANL